VITSLPTGRVLVVTVTVFELAVTVPLPSVLPPLEIVIVPVAPVGTDAVIVTGDPYVLGPEVVTVTVGFNFAIVSIIVETTEP
jgi:hypothetical protein